MSTSDNPNSQEPRRLFFSHVPYQHFIHPYYQGRQRYSHSRIRNNLIAVLEDQRMGLLSPRETWRQLHVHPAFVPRLRVLNKLKGHTGCVNHLSWNSSGTILASGSDDTKLVLWDYEKCSNPIQTDDTIPQKSRKNQALISYQTQHAANIFAVKFLPYSGDKTLITGAADSEVRLHQIDQQHTSAFYCHSGACKVEIDPSDSNLFWSASEDGTVRQFDRRIPHSGCNNQSRPRGNLFHSPIRVRRSERDCDNILIDLRGRSHRESISLEAIAINPTRPEYLSVASRDPYVRVFDRRMLSVGRHRLLTGSETGEEQGLEGLACVFSPPHLHRKHGNFFGSRSSAGTTSTVFSPDGSELLATFSSDHAYTFDLQTALAKTHFHKPDYLSVLSNPSFPSTTPPSSDLLLGFWSDDQVTDLLNLSLTSQREKQENHREMGLCTHHIAKMTSNRLKVEDNSYERRAISYLKRGWPGDADAALRDCEQLLNQDPLNIRAHFLFFRALLRASLKEEAGAYLIQISSLAPQVKAFHQIFSQLESEQPRQRRSIYRDEDDSFFEDDGEEDVEEMEDGDEDEGDDEEDEDDDDDEVLVGEMIEVSPEPGSQNSEPQREGSSSRNEETPSTVKTENTVQTNEESTQKIQQANPTQKNPLFDIANTHYTQRFVGHCNSRTIKEASFFGDAAQFVVCGSDDGKAYIYDRETGLLVNMIDADQDVVNCVQGHPYDIVLATSGIESVVRLWAPLEEKDQEFTYSSLSDTFYGNRNPPYQISISTILRHLRSRQTEEGAAECRIS